MSVQSALKIIDKELGVDGDGSPEYEALKTALGNWFNSNELDQFANFLQDENS
jgi:hypothetical protein